MVAEKLRNVYTLSLCITTREFVLEFVPLAGLICLPLALRTVLAISKLR